LALLRRVLDKLVTAPAGDAGMKFRRLKLSVDTMAKLVVGVPGALNAFVAIGFEQVNAPSPAGVMEEYLLFKCSREVNSKIFLQILVL